MKAQGIPIKTIVILVISIVALVAFVIFLFVSFSSNKNYHETYSNISLNQAQEACINAFKIGSNPSGTCCINGSFAPCPEGSICCGGECCSSPKVCEDEKCVDKK